MLSRLTRAFELRVTDVNLDPMAQRFIRDCGRRDIRFIANEPDARDRAEYSDKIRQINRDNDLPRRPGRHLRRGHDHRPLRLRNHPAGSPARSETDATACSPCTARPSPTRMAALLLYVGDRTRTQPHMYFEWTEGNPVTNFLRFLFFGVGEVAPITREVLRRAEPNRERRPHIHVG